MKNTYKAILFDMDGTLLPMDMHEFTHGYFKLLCKKLSGFGYDDEKLIDAIWKGVGAMVMNDGTVKNEDVFWKVFEKLMGGPLEEVKAYCSEFYGKEFDGAKCFTAENPLAKTAVEVAKTKAPIVALATNPLFPMCGQVTRMNWVGLSPEDFAEVTSYETCTTCKPNPMYFQSLCDKLGVAPQDCLMIGNDENEDMYCCSKLGMDGYLVTDTMIPSKEHPWEGPKGSFNDMIEMLQKLETSSREN